MKPPDHDRGLPKEDPELWKKYEKVRGGKSPRVTLYEDQLVRVHGGLAMHWMKRYLAMTRLEVEHDDAWQCAQIGLLRALRTYDRNKAHYQKGKGYGLFAAWTRIYVWCELHALARLARGRGSNASPLTAEEYRRVAAWEAEHGTLATASDVGIAEGAMRDYRLMPKFVELPEDLAVYVDYEGFIDEKRRLGLK